MKLEDSNTVMKLDDLDTGDMILFNGNYFVSNIVEYITGSIFSHVGVIIKNPIFFDKKLDGLYLLESGYEDQNDVENERHKLGVQLTDFTKLYNTYDGKIFVRKLECNRDKEFYEKIDQIHSDVHNVPYDINIIDWFKAGLNIDIGDIQKRNMYWCSALTCYIYVKLGFLDKDIPWTLIKPQDLSSTSNNLYFTNCVMCDDKLINN